MSQPGNSTTSGSQPGFRREADLDGFIVRWLLRRVPEVRAGDNPFECDYLNGESSYVPRMGRDGGPEPGWITFEARYGYKVDLHRALGLVKPPGAAYAACYLISPSARPAFLRVGSDDGHKLWINHVLVGARRVERGLGVDQDIYPIQLQGGVNLILLKIEQIFGAFEFCCRLTDAQGNALEGMAISIAVDGRLEQSEPAATPALTDNDLFSGLMQTQVPRLSCRTDSVESFFQWQGRFKKALEGCLGDTPPRGSGQASIIRTDDEGDYIRELIHYDLMPGAVASAYLLLPKTQDAQTPPPVIFNLPGHGAGKDHIAGIVQKRKQARGEQVLEWEIPYASAPLAVRQGYAVFVPEFLPFGDRQASESPIHDACDQMALWALALGYTLPRLNCLAISRGLDYLEQRADVDASRVAAMGHSLGGFMSMLGAAIEPRIRAVVISGMLGSFSLSKGGTWTCGSQTIPGILRFGDMADIAALIAPRPVLAISGMYDCCAPFIYAVQAHRLLAQVYSLLGHAERFERYIFPGDHIFHPRPALDFIKRWMPLHSVDSRL